MEIRGGTKNTKGKHTQIVTKFHKTTSAFFFVTVPVL